MSGKSISSVLQDLTTDNGIYINDRYALWSQNGITYKMFKDSYNAIVGENAQNLEGTELGGYRYKRNNVSRLTGTLQEDIYNYGYADIEGNFKYYWLATPSVDWSNRLMHMDCYGGKVGTMSSLDTLAVRPLFCLNSNVKLEESGVRDANGYMTYNLSLQ